MIFNQCVNVAPQRQPGKHKVKRAQGTQGLIKGLVVEQVQVAEFKKRSEWSGQVRKGACGGLG